MGTIGKRQSITNKTEEPTLWADVNDILKDLHTHGYINDCVVDIKKIIEDNGIQIIYDDSLPSSTSGYLKKVSDKNWVIVVNKNHNPKRQRFTLAHELGHYILHKNEDTCFEDSILFRDDHVSPLEYSANRFAAELLMPSELITQSIKRGSTTLEELADKFQVSVLAVKQRILTLGYQLRHE